MSGPQPDRRIIRLKAVSACATVAAGSATRAAAAIFYPRSGNR